MTFQVGEKVVYPNHGVATVENISVRSFGNRQERFYLLRLAASSMTVMVPLSHAADVGLRRVTKNGTVEQVLRFLEAGECREARDWKDRFKENSERMRNGGLLEVAQVLKNLLLLEKRKPLSFREKKMLDTARHMLIMEISISRAIRESQAAELLDRALRKCGLELPPPLRPQI